MSKWGGWRSGRDLLKRKERCWWASHFYPQAEAPFAPQRRVEADCKSLGGQTKACGVSSRCLLGESDCGSSVGSWKLSIEASTNGKHGRPLKQPATSSRDIHMIVRSLALNTVSSLVTMLYSLLAGKGIPTAVQTKTTPDTKGKGGGCDRLQAAPETTSAISRSMPFILTERMQLADQFWTAIVSVCYSAREQVSCEWSYTISISTLSIGVSRF